MKPKEKKEKKDKTEKTEIQELYRKLRNQFFEIHYNNLNKK